MPTHASHFKAVLLRNAAFVGVLAASVSLPAAAQQTSVTDVGAFDKATADRAIWERLDEATQIKGDGETHSFLSPNDEFASFERWDKGNLDLSELKKPEMIEFEYARSALKNGLKLEGRLGVNPYKFGMIGSTDAHTGLAAVEEDNFFGKTASSEPSPTRATHPFVKTGRAVIMGLGDDRLRLRRRLGEREHARGDFRCDAASGDVCDDGTAHAGPLVRRLGLRRSRRQYPEPCDHRLHQGCADGR
jgi:Protein of unknown function (DUF3604)